MTALTDLSELLENLEPRILDGEFIFVSIPGGRYGDVAGLKPVACCAENEGLSLLLGKEQARAAGFNVSEPQRMISLGIYSSLLAVGLTAAISRALSDANIPANIIAAYHHDHVLVPSGLAEQAQRVLKSLCNS